MKKFLFTILIFFTGISIGYAKTIRSCTYNSNPDSYDGQKYVLLIKDDYSYTFYSYVYDHNKFAYGAGHEQDLKNWDDNVKKAIKEKKKCPPYLVNAPSNILADDKFYVYFNKEKAEKRKKDAFLWLGALINVVEDKDMGDKTDSKTDIEDKEDGTKDVESPSKDVIKEYKKTYPLSAMSSELLGKEYVFYTKYNLTKNQSLSTQSSIKGNDRSIGLIYPGSIDDFSKNVIDPIVKSDKYPETFFCGEISPSLLVAQNVTVLLGTTNTGDIVCSPDKNAFIDSTNKLSNFTTKYESPSKAPDIDYMPGSSIDPSVSSAIDKDTCEIIKTGTQAYIFIKKVVNYIKIGTIFLVLVLGMVDLAGAVGSGEENAFKKAAGKFGKRLIAVALVFLVPAMVEILIGLINTSNCKDVDTVKEIYE